MVKNYLILKDVIDQSDVLARANRAYKGDIVAILYGRTPDKSKEVIAFIKEHGYAIVSVRGNVVLSITKLEDEQ
jgi:hypothetical protein